MTNYVILPGQLETRQEKTGNKLKDKNLWDTVWVPEEKTGLLVKVTIVHKFHVPGAYTKAVEQHESNPDNIVWARHELGNGHFRWFALYADSEAYDAPEGVTDSDKFLTHYSNKRLRRPQDETTNANFVQKFY